MNDSFVPGLELSRRYYLEVVRPLVHEHFGELPHTAARIGSGSEVLGFDTPRSADHEWGPRLQLFLRPEDRREIGERVHAVLAEKLPKSFLGYPTHFVSTGEPHIGVMAATDGPVNHRIEVADLGSWFDRVLGFDPRCGPTTADWLATPTQALAEVTAGAVFHDGLAELTPARQRLAWYPPEVWRFVLARQWARLSQEEAFVGRCGEVGDELGSAVVAARLVRDLMRLCLLMERRYPPYGKWLGSAFGALPVAAVLRQPLASALAAVEWRERERHLVVAYETVAARHNELGLTPSVAPATRPYHSRPFRVLHAERFSAALLATVTDPELCGPGAVDQWLDNTPLLTDLAATRRAAEVLRADGRVM